MKSRDPATQLEGLEGKRQAAQRTLDVGVPQSERNARGQYATPPGLAEAMVQLARELFPDLIPVRFLDPGVGTGAFFSALLKIFGTKTLASAVGFEVDARLFSQAKKLWGHLGLQARLSDFTKASPPRKEDERPNLIICNPPYVRHHHLEGDVKARLKKRVCRMGMRINGLAGLYCYFLLLSDDWLAPNGGAVWIVPAEFLDVNYGTILKQYLAQKVTTLRIHRFHPMDVQFNDALVSSVIVAYRKTSPTANHNVSLTSGRNLLQPEWSRMISCRDLNPREKWSRFFETSEFILPHPDRPTLADLFSIKRGLATGANKFFIMKETEAKELGLPPEFLRPIIPSQRLVPHDVINRDPEGFPSGMPRMVLLDCPLTREIVAERYPSLLRYIQKGEQERIHKRYLPRHRAPWYSQEHRPPAPIICTYMGRMKKSGRCFRFIRNRSRATTVNVYLVLYPKDELSAAIHQDPSILDEILEYLHQVEHVEREGRVYGGGLHKLEPSELGRLEVPEYILEKVRAAAKASDGFVLQQGSNFAS